MAVLEPREASFAEAISRLVYANPFLPERIDCERAALGAAFVDVGADWNVHAERFDDHANVQALQQRVGRLVEAARSRLASGAALQAGERPLYEALLLFHLYHRYRTRFDELIRSSPGPTARVDFYPAFLQDARPFVSASATLSGFEGELPHVFACFFQIRRAFHHIFRNITGLSRPAARFRAVVWQSIFTHDMRRFRRVLYDRMADFTTLITGPSGTGKELAARAIGLSRYIAFDANRGAFAVAGHAPAFCAVNLPALSPTLIESELFGHRRGSFTGAVADRAGWFESCPATGTVFLDEIGDLEEPLQVKLLRVLQSRTFQRIGDTRELTFGGKIIAATNRDLHGLRGSGRFRDELYYRLCADLIRVPSLHERLRDTPGELRHLIEFIAHRLVGDEAENLADEVERFIERHLPPVYTWPGNVRELEQCVRNVLIRREYQPIAAGDDARRLAEALEAGGLTADEVLARYCRLVYARCGSFSEAARRLGIDRRTVKSKIEAMR